MENFQTILRFFTNQKSTIGYSVMALLTIGGERVFTLISFQCPCNLDQNFAYGLTFLLGPAAVLLVLGLFFSTRLWRLYTGCCLDPMKLCPRGRCWGCCRALMSIISGACVAPVMWLCVALLNGTFYECAISGLNDNLVVDLFCKNKTLACREELALVPCDRSKLSSDERMELLLMFRAQSQILGWSIIITATIIGLLGTCYKNCRSEVSYLQLTFWKRYVEKEKERFDDLAVEYANKLAERNLKSFFEDKKPPAMPFPDHKAWEQISAYYSFSRKEQYYSILQRYVETTDFPQEVMTPLMEIERGRETSSTLMTNEEEVPPI